MKKISIILLSAAMATLAACSSGSEDGTRLGNELATAWNDSTALDSVMNAVKAMRDDLTFTGSFDEALIESATQSGDTRVEMAAHLLTESDENFAEGQAQHIIDGLLKKNFDAHAAQGRLVAAHAAAERLDRRDAIKALEATLDEKAASLSIDDQMRVYAAASTPAALGRALADDASEPNADKEHINKQIEALRSIYSAEDFQTFMKNYEQ